MDKPLHDQDVVGAEEQSVEATADFDWTGKLLSERFQITGKLGAGAVGTVWKADNIHSAGEHAIKILNPEFTGNERSRQRFLAEARSASRLNHDNVVMVQAFGIDGRTSYIVMQYVDGVTLAQCAKKLSMEQKIDVFCQIASALSYAHEQGIVHRDLKPSNVIVAKEDDGVHAWILDFGISKLLTDDNNQALTLTGDIVGSPLYMSPEQCLGKRVDIRTDIYSFGCLMYEVILGKPPFCGASALDTMRMHVEQALAPFAVSSRNLEVPIGLEEIVCKALAKDPDQRFQSVTEIGDLLRNLDLSSLRSISERKSKALPVAILAASLVLAAVGFVCLQKRIIVPASDELREEALYQALPNKRMSASSAHIEAMRLGAQAGPEAARRYLEDWYRRWSKYETDFPELQETRDQLANYRFALNDYAGGLALLETNFKEQGEKFGAANENYFIFGNKLVKAYTEMNLLDKTDELLQKLEKQYLDRKDQLSDATYVSILFAKSQMLYKMQRFQELEQTLKQGRQLSEKLYRTSARNDHFIPDKLAEFHSLTAKILTDKRDLKAAEHHLREMMKIESTGKDTIFAREPDRYSQRALSLEENLIEQGRYDEARKIIKNSLYIEEFLASNKFSGINKERWRSRVADVCRAHLRWLALSYYRQGKISEAQAVLDKLFQYYSADTEPHSDLELAVFGRQLLLDYNDTEAAKKCAEFLKNHQQLLANHAQVAQTISLTADQAARNGRLNSAEFLKRQAQSIAKLGERQKPSSRQ